MISGDALPSAPARLPHCVCLNPLNSFPHHPHLARSFRTNTDLAQTFDCPIRILVYGNSEPRARAMLEQQLKSDKLLKATELNQTRPKAPEPPRKAMGLKGSRSTAGVVPGAPEVSLEQLAQTSQAVQFRAGDDNLKALAMDEDTLSKLPMAPQPQALKSQLLPYQLQGLAWLQSKESPQFPPPGSDNATQLWKRTHNGQYRNVATNYTAAATAAPRLAKGGILADDMGLVCTSACPSLPFCESQTSTDVS